MKKKSKLELILPAAEGTLLAIKAQRDLSKRTAKAYNNIMQAVKKYEQQPKDQKWFLKDPVTDLCYIHGQFTFMGDNGITYCSNCGEPA